MSIAHILDRAAEATQWQEALYKDLHQHPELSMEEERTRGIIADKLREFPRVEVLEFGGGVVGILRNGEGSTVLERADFDGLPIAEDTGLDYSATGEAMHACGHDTHVTALLGATEALAKATDAWSGTFIALFQPGEETAEGAQSMVDAGLTDKVPTPDVAFGQHIFIDKNAPAGSVLIAPGPVLSTATSLTVTVYGHGSHGSMPHLSVDPVVLASSIVLRLQTVVSREVDPHQFAVLTVGALQAGSKANIIPDSATLRINIRAYDEDVRAQIVEAIHRIVNAECQAAMSPREPEIVQSDNFPPPSMMKASLRRYARSLSTSSVATTSSTWSRGRRPKTSLGSPMPSALPIAFGALVAARTACPSRTTIRALHRSCSRRSPRRRRR